MSKTGRLERETAAHFFQQARADPTIAHDQRGFLSMFNPNAFARPASQTPTNAMILQEPSTDSVAMSLVSIEVRLSASR